MLGMHGTYEANMAMHDCDVMVCIGARFDDRITGRIDAFSPGSRKIHIDIDASSINKNVRVDVADRRRRRPGARGHAHRLEGRKRASSTGAALKEWWDADRRAGGRATRSPIARTDDVIMPQYAIQRLYEATKDTDVYITTEVGQHQMWAAQFYPLRGAEPLDDVRRPRHHGLRPAGGDRRAGGASESLVIDIAGDASVLMTMQEMSTAVQHELPIKIFILNNQYMGMVRQWQQLLHGNRLSHSYTDSLPDFVKLAEAYGCVGIRAEHPAELDDAIAEMIAVKKPVIFDCRVANARQLLPDDPLRQGAQRDAAARPRRRDEAVAGAVDEAGRVMV